MGILSRFKLIMKANIHSLVAQAENPEKVINDYIRSLNRDLGTVKAETAAVLMNERRAKSLLDECNAEIKKLQRYAEKCVEEGNDDKALKFLEKKSQHVKRLSELSAAYEQASSDAANIKRMQDKLVSDIGQLEARHAELKGKLASAKVHAGGISANQVQAAFEAAEEKANFAIDKAMALAELQADDEADDFDKKFAQLEKGTDNGNSIDSPANVNVDDELAAMKERLRKKE